MAKTFAGLLTTLAASALLILPGCSTTNLSPVEAVQVKELSLLLSRTALSGTDFEQYKLASDGSLFIECGVIKGGRYIPTFQKLDELDDEHKQKLEHALATLLTTTNYQKNSFDSPGKHINIIDRGKFEVTFSADTESGLITNSVQTSLDSVADPTNPGERQLKELATQIRTGVSFYEPICNNREFYGLPGKLYPRNRLSEES